MRSIQCLWECDSWNAPVPGTPSVFVQILCPGDVEAAIRLNKGIYDDNFASANIAVALLSHTVSGSLSLHELALSDI